MGIPSAAASCELRLAEKNAELEKLGEKAEILKKGLDGAMIEQKRAEARCELFATRETFLLNGWVRSDEAEKLEQIVSEASSVHYLEMRDPYDDEQPPTCCRNNKDRNQINQKPAVRNRPFHNRIAGFKTS